MSAFSAPDRRFFVAIDMERYSARDNELQYRAQRVFQQALDDATVAVGVDRSSWIEQQGGDGALAILPPGTPEPTILHGLIPALHRFLIEHNRYLVPNARVRLRVSLHEGLVHVDGANGFPGQSVNDACRLLDAPVLKRALAAFPDAAVALIVSDHVYRDLVQQYNGELRPERFRRVRADLPDKQFAADAWVCVVDEDVTALPEPRLLPVRPEVEKAQRPAEPEDTAVARAKYLVERVDGVFAMGDGASVDNRGR